LKLYITRNNYATRWSSTWLRSTPRPKSGRIDWSRWMRQVLRGRGNGYRGCHAGDRPIHTPPYNMHSATLEHRLYTYWLTEDQIR